MVTTEAAQSNQAGKSRNPQRSNLLIIKNKIQSCLNTCVAEYANFPIQSVGSRPIVFETRLAVILFCILITFL